MKKILSLLLVLLSTLGIAQIVGGPLTLATGWAIGGNTTTAVKSLGTKSNFGWQLISNNTARAGLLSGGNFTFANAVGIGTTSPEGSYSLDVNGTVNLRSTLTTTGNITTVGRVNVFNPSDDVKMSFTRTGGKNWTQQLDASRFFIYNQTDAAYGWVTLANGATGFGGQVNPSYTVDISGSARITGTVQATGTVNIGSGTYGTDNLHQLRVTKGTGTVDIGEYIAGRAAIWLGQNTPAIGNFALSHSGTGTTFLNAGTQTSFLINGGIQMTHSDLQLTFGSGLASFNLSFPSTTGTKLGLSSSEKIGIYGVTPIVQPVNTTPINAVLVNTGLWASGGHSTFTNRLETAKGANIASANDLTLGTDGNVFHITGNTTINAIITSGWQAGSEITLIFDGTPTVKNNTAGGGGTAVMLLAGALDFSATANDVLRLVYDGTSFFEISRSAN